MSILIISSWLQESNRWHVIEAPFVLIKSPFLLAHLAHMSYHIPAAVLHSQNIQIRLAAALFPGGKVGQTQLVSHIIEYGSSVNQLGIFKDLLCKYHSTSFNHDSAVLHWSCDPGGTGESATHGVRLIQFLCWSKTSVVHIYIYR